MLRSTCPNEVIQVCAAEVHHLLLVHLHISSAHLHLPDPPDRVPGFRDGKHLRNRCPETEPKTVPERKRNASETE